MGEDMYLPLSMLLLSWLFLVSMIQKINIEDDIHDCYIGYYCDVKSVWTIEDDYFIPTTECDDHDWDNEDTTYNL